MSLNGKVVAIVCLISMTISGIAWSANGASMPFLPVPPQIIRTQCTARAIGDGGRTERRSAGEQFLI